MPRQRNQVFGLGVFLLANKLFNTGIRHIPPITLLLILVQTALYMGILSPPWDHYEVCLSGEAILYYKDYRRLFLSAIEHADDFHLYHNMASFILKGKTLETRFGTLKFCILLLSFVVSTSLVYVGVAKAAYFLFDDYSYMKQCAIGFSGVLFALKVLTTFYSEEREQYVYGFFVPSKYAAWIELLIIHILVPKASFMGHLAGIIVGILYIQGPLKIIVDSMFNLLTFSASSGTQFSSSSYTYTHGRSSAANSEASNRSPAYGWDIDEDLITNNDQLTAEELRRRRLNRYDS